MPFPTIRAVANAAAENGNNWQSFFYKTGGPNAFGAGRWGDASMGAGTPKYNAYVGSQATATPLIGSGNDGINVGPGLQPSQTRHLMGMSVQASNAATYPAHFLLCDYLMHYPLIDGDSTDQQDMDNTATLPRYLSGEGVMAMAVCTTPMAANAACTVTYTNQDGTSGRQASFGLIASSVVGTIISSSNTSLAAASVSPFVPLANGDRGIRKIDSVTNLTGAGGFFALVLVKPIAGIQLREAVTATEIMQIPQRADLPTIEAGAYLNWIFQMGGNGSPFPGFRGHLDFVWN